MTLADLPGVSADLMHWKPQDGAPKRDVNVGEQKPHEYYSYIYHKP